MTVEVLPSTPRPVAPHTQEWLRPLDPVVALRGEGCCVEPLPAAERADDPCTQRCESRPR